MRQGPEAPDGILQCLGGSGCVRAFWCAGGVEEEESGRESCHYRLSGAHGADFYGLGRVRGEHVLEVGPAGRQRSVEGQLRGCRRSEEHTSEIQSLMRISYAVFCLI